MNDPKAPPHWHVKLDQAEFYVAGKLVLCIPARQYATLAVDLIAALRSPPVMPNRE